MALREWPWLLKICFCDVWLSARCQVATSVFFWWRARGERPAWADFCQRIEDVTPSLPFDASFSCNKWHSATLTLDHSLSYRHKCPRHWCLVELDGILPPLRSMIRWEDIYLDSLWLWWTDNKLPVSVSLSFCLCHSFSLSPTQRQMNTHTHSQMCTKLLKRAPWNTQTHKRRYSERETSVHCKELSL